MAWLVFSIVVIVLGFLAVVLWSLIAVSQAMDCEDVDFPDALRGSVESVVNRRRGVPWDEITGSMVTEEKLAESKPGRQWPTGSCVGADVGVLWRCTAPDTWKRIELGCGLAMPPAEVCKMEPCETGETQSRLKAIKRALELEMPPLTLDDQRWLYLQATGEQITKTPQRCAWCHGDGSVEKVMNGEAIPLKCGSCNGTGFTR